MAEEIVCVVCGSTASFRGAFKGLKRYGHQFEVRLCESCGLGVTVPFLDEEEFRRIYSSTSFRADDSTRFFAPLERLIRVLRRRRCAEVERYADKGRILDIGCGRADFLEMMAERGWQATGLELDERIVEHADRIKGVELRQGALEDVRFEDSSFEAVSFWHVFEHLRDPVWALRECRRILKPGGLLVIAVPNAASLQAKMSGRHWFHLDPPHHLYHYTLANITRMLSDAGFDVASVSHFSLEYNPYGFVQSIYDSMRLRPNLLYDFLRSRGVASTDGLTGLGGWLALAVVFLTMPLVLPASAVLSVLEAVVKRGGTIDVYAKKR